MERLAQCSSLTFCHYLSSGLTFLCLNTQIVFFQFVEKLSSLLMSSLVSWDALIHSTVAVVFSRPSIFFFHRLS